MVKEQLVELGNKISLAKLELSETHQEEVEIDALLAYGDQFIRTAELAWYEWDIQSQAKISKANLSKRSKV